MYSFPCNCRSLRSIIIERLPTAEGRTLVPRGDRFCLTFPSPPLSIQYPASLWQFVNWLTTSQCKLSYIHRQPVPTSSFRTQRTAADHAFFVRSTPSIGTIAVFGFATITTTKPLKQPLSIRGLSVWYVASSAISCHLFILNTATKYFALCSTRAIVCCCPVSGGSPGNRHVNPSKLYYFRSPEMATKPRSDFCICIIARAPVMRSSPAHLAHNRSRLQLIVRSLNGSCAALAEGERLGSPSDRGTNDQIVIKGRKGHLKAAVQ